MTWMAQNTYLERSVQQTGLFTCVDFTTQALDTYRASVKFCPLVIISRLMEFLKLHSLMCNKVYITTSPLTGLL